MTSGDLQNLIQHLEWADATVWRSVLESSEDGLDSKIEFWLHHLHATEHGFTCMWRGAPMKVAPLADFQDPRSLARWGREAHRGMQDFLGKAGGEDLEKPLQVPASVNLEERLGRAASEVTVGQSMLQVALHSTHHRGQIAARIRETGGEPPTLDFIFWLWMDRPDPSWPEGL